MTGGTLPAAHPRAATMTTATTTAAATATAPASPARPTAPPAAEARAPRPKARTDRMPRRMRTGKGRRGRRTVPPAPPNPRPDRAAPPAVPAAWEPRRGSRDEGCYLSLGAAFGAGRSAARNPGRRQHGAILRQCRDWLDRKHGLSGRLRPERAPAGR
ncbi:hypothetical protein C5F46_12810 [Phaeovulum veldkampii DSM 11550]|uniref:Uncharacterized protein n=1 Tax=Phaeovulum veldkampii DSM 11550 TaxID=1185920 RepID=A0A2T4JFQ1_9RHOB|nr:hypothetical protein C5F46_12810 [Phaeovulum veldkampii DSM 11550]